MKEMPNRIEDLSPLPRTPMKNSKKGEDKFNFNMKNYQ